VKKIRKVLCIALALVLAAAMLLPAGALAAGSYSALEAEQYAAVMPYFDFYFYPTDSEGATVYGMDLSNTQVTALLDDEILSVDGLENAKSHGAAYIFVIDISKENSDYHFVEAVKKGLVKWVESMGQNDRLLIVTYADDIFNVLDGDEDAAEAIKCISNIEQRLGTGRFYEAMSHAITLAAEKTGLPDRRIIISVENGASVAKSASKADETAQAAVEAGHPIYSFCNGTIDTSRQAMLDLTTATGGKTVFADYRTAETAMEEAHTRFDSCYVLSLRAKTNFVEPVNRRFALELVYEGVSNSLSLPVVINYWYTDADAPFVKNAKADDENTLVVTFSENVTGADNAENFVLTHTGMGKEYPISEADYDIDSATATLTVDDELVQGDYTLEVSGVYDFSMEFNPIAADYEYTFTLEDDSLDKPSFYIDFASFGLTAWLVIGLIVLLAAAAVVVFLVYRKRRQAEEQHLAEEKKWRQEQERRQQEEIERRKREELARKQQSGTNGQRFVADRVNSLPVTIVVVQENGIKRSIDAVVGEKFIIGREAKSCELAIDDKLLSRQHMCLSFRNGSLLVRDLGSTNKTFLNGVVINAERQLQPNDVIMAGKTRIIVNVKLN